MYLVIHTSLRSPVIVVLLILSLLLVFAILLSDRAERKRDRKVRELVERSRQKARQGMKPLPAMTQTAGAGTAQPADAGSPSRFFQGRFLWVGLICLVAVSIVVLTQKSSRTVQAKTIQENAVEALGYGVTNLAVGENLESLLELWYTNDPAQDVTRWPEAVADQASAGRERRLESTPVQVTISSPAGAVADPNAPSSVNWDVVKSIRPAQSDVPKPPPGLRSLPK
jgi:hypothetical protein